MTACRSSERSPGAEIVYSGALRADEGMRIQAHQEGRMEQGLALLPKMLQSIEVLRLTTGELLELIDRELQQNETLVAEPAGVEPEVVPAHAEVPGEGPGEEPSQAPDRDDWVPRTGSGEEDRKQAFLQNLPAPGESLLAHVREQLAWLDVPPPIVAGVCALVERLDHRGLLAAAQKDLAEVCGTGCLDECLAVLQSLEPRGIGAPDAVAAMLLQLSPDDPDAADIEAMLTAHLDALAKNRLPDVARAIGRTVDEVRGLVARIRALDPHPGSRFAAEYGNESVLPDVLVRWVDGRIEVEVDEMSLPDLGIEGGYASMAQSVQTDLEVRRYLKDKLRSARDLIVAVEQRKRTLARATLAIMRRQEDFLVQGPLAVRPLAMEEIADDLGVHVSTVSRAIAGKFVQTDHGIFRLREFFDGDRRNERGETDTMGRMAIRDHIRDLIRQEDPRCPLSDSEIVSGLLQRNIKVARRTVAKYRCELGLAPSWRRRSHGAEDD